MDAGLIVYNDDGRLVIDGEFKNLAFFSAGSASTTTVVDNFSTRSITLNGLNGMPLIAVRSPDGGWANVRSYSNGTAVVDFVIHGPVGTAFDYYVFEPPRPTTTTHGFEVFNSAGELVFSSEHRYMRVAGSISAKASTFASESITLPAGRTYAVMQTGPMAYARNVNQGTGTMPDWLLISIRGCYKVGANVITKVADEYGVQSWGSTPGPYYDIAATGFVLDVTNY